MANKHVFIDPETGVELETAPEGWVFLLEDNAWHTLPEIEDFKAKYPDEDRRMEVLEEQLLKTADLTGEEKASVREKYL